MSLHIWDIIRYFKEDKRINFSKFSKDVDIQRRVLYTYADRESTPDYMREKGLINYFKENYDLPEKIKSFYEEDNKRIKASIDKNIVYEVIKEGIKRDKKKNERKKIESEYLELMITFLGYKKNKPIEKASGEKSTKNYIYIKNVTNYILTISQDKTEKNKYLIDLMCQDDEVTFENKQITIINGYSTIDMPDSDNNSTQLLIKKDKINIDEDFKVFVERKNDEQ